MVIEGSRTYWRNRRRYLAWWLSQCTRDTPLEVMERLVRALREANAHVHRRRAS